MSQRGILWLTGVVPNVKISGLNKKLNEELSKILFEELMTALNEQILEQKNLEPADLYNQYIGNSYDIAFTNERQKFLLVGNKRFSDSNLEEILSHDRDIFIIFLCRPNSTKKSIIEVAKRYELPVITQAVPEIDWSPKSELIGRNLDSELERMNRTSFLQPGNEMKSQIMGFLNRINNEKIKNEVLRLIKRWKPLVMDTLVRTLLECIIKGGCQYLGIYCG